MSSSLRKVAARSCHHARSKLHSRTHLTFVTTAPRTSRRTLSGSSKPETTEEMAKRLSDEVDGRHKASGAKSNLRHVNPASALSQSHQSATQAAEEQKSQSSDAADNAATSASANDSASDAIGARSSRQSIFTTVTNEWQHLRTYMKKFQRPGTQRAKRSAEQVKQVLANENPYVPVEKKPLDDTQENEVGEPAENEVGTKDLVLVDSSTVWDKRLERMKTAFGSSSPILTFRKAKRTLIHNENPILKPLHTLSQSVNEAIDDAKLTWETSQHPTLFKVRDLTDRVIGENEQGFTIGEIMKVDPNFDTVDFIEEMEHYMIPAVVTAYLRGTPRDWEMLKGVSEGPAASALSGSLKARDAQGVKWDDNILDISSVELVNAIMRQDLPVLQLSFVVQQIQCARSTKKYKPKAGEEHTEGQVVEGSESQIASIYYLWHLRRDFENPDFDWKITDFVSQEMFKLEV